MMDEEVIKKFSEENLILSSEGFSKITEHNLNPEEIISKAKERGEWLITPEFLEEFFKKEEPVQVIRRTSAIPAKEIEPQLKINDDSDVTGKSTSSGKLEDFLEYFNQKYVNLRDILKDR